MDPMKDVKLYDAYGKNLFEVIRKERLAPDHDIVTAIKKIAQDRHPDHASKLKETPAQLKQREADFKVYWAWYEMARDGCLNEYRSRLVH